MALALRIRRKSLALALTLWASSWSWTWGPVLAVENFDWFMLTVIADKECRNAYCGVSSCVTGVKIRASVIIFFYE